MCACIHYLTCWILVCWVQYISVVAVHAENPSAPGICWDAGSRSICMWRVLQWLDQSSMRTWLLRKKAVWLDQACWNVLSSSNWSRLVHEHICCQYRQSQLVRQVWIFWVLVAGWSGNTWTWLLCKQAVGLVWVHVDLLRGWPSLIYTQDGSMNRWSSWSRCLWICCMHFWICWLAKSSNSKHDCCLYRYPVGLYMHGPAQFQWLAEKYTEVNVVWVWTDDLTGLGVCWGDPTDPSVYGCAKFQWLAD